MKPKTFRLTDLALVFALLFSGGNGAAAPRQTSPQAAIVPDKAVLAAKFGLMPLLFIQNQGQMDSRAAFYVQGQDTSVYFAPDGLTFALSAPVAATTLFDPLASLLKPSQPQGLDQPAFKTSRWTLKLDFVGANPGVTPQGEDPAQTRVSYFKGSPNQWYTGLPTYHRLVYPDLWPGIDLAYSGTLNRMKYEFVVNPGADPRQIRLAYRGTRGLGLDETGQMEVSTPLGSIQDEAPTAYQLSGGVERPVSAAYQLQGSAAQRLGGDGGAFTPDETAFSFQVSSYNPSLPLVIDPAVLVYCGYLGGSGDEFGNSIAVDASGAAYVTGVTTSNQATFPVNGGPDLTYNGSDDAFVVKVSPDGSGLVYAGYIGGAGSDRANGIAVDASGAAYITGNTASPQSSFPVLGGPDLTFNGVSDAFVTKVNPAGTGLVYAGYIGGFSDETGAGIALDDSGAAYITGWTSSPETGGLPFPVSGGPDLTYNGATDIFVAKVLPDGSALVYCGYIGGSGLEHGTGIALDGSGNAFISGYTNSNQTTFPVKGGPDLTLNGGEDAFVAEVSSDGSGLVYNGYVGGAQDDEAYGIALDGAGAAYIDGFTSSDQTTFPVSGGPDLTYNEAGDAFVAKILPDGSGLVYAGYIGGSGVDRAWAIAVDQAEAAYVTGMTFSDETTFPVKVGPDLTYNDTKGHADAFIARVRPDGAGLSLCGYIGGGDTDVGFGIALDGNRAAYITGLTISDQTTFPVKAGPDLTYNGGHEDAYVVKINTGRQVYLPFLAK